jgi:hypothetical protein
VGVERGAGLQDVHERAQQRAVAKPVIEEADDCRRGAVSVWVGRDRIEEEK